MLEILRKYSRTTYSHDLKCVYYPFNHKIFGLVYFDLHFMETSMYKGEFNQDNTTSLLDFKTPDELEKYILDNIKKIDKWINTTLTKKNYTYTL